MFVQPDLEHLTDASISPAPRDVCMSEHRAENGGAGNARPVQVLGQQVVGGIDEMDERVFRDRLRSAKHEADRRQRSTKLAEVR